MGKLRDAARDMQARVLMKVPGVMDDYWGWMHAFHDIPLDGCDGLGHSHDTRAFRAGFERGKADSRKPARDELERQRRAWEDAGNSGDYPAWVEKISIACSKGDCNLCRWPLCSCPHHSGCSATEV